MNASTARRAVWTVAISFASAAACAVLAVFVLSGAVTNNVTTAVAAALVYMLPLLALQATTENALRRRADASGFPVDWIIYVSSKLAVGVAAAAIGSAVALLLGIITRWQDLYLTNRMVVVFSLVVACVVRVYDTTRNRLEERAHELEREVAYSAKALRVHEQEAASAREIQQGLMPRQLPQLRGFQFSAACQPALTVAGDYYDAIRLSGSSVAILVGDVSGKGMPAALLMSNLQAIVRVFAPAGLAPAELCAKANQLIAANVAPGKYVTFFYAIVDTERRRVDYCNAGHNPPLLAHADGAVETLGEGGPVLGVFRDAPYCGGSAVLRSGDTLVLFTDGITEAMNANDEEFGDERLLAAVRGDIAGADACHKRILSAVAEFANGIFHDDATILVMTVN